MKKSCSYCGRIHPAKYECPKRPKLMKRESDAVRFRNTAAWRRKRDEVRERDLHLCQLCIRGLFAPEGQKIRYQDVQVHHIIPIVEDWEKRLANENLLTLCGYHHELAEAGKIPRKALFEVAAQQEVPPLG